MKLKEIELFLKQYIAAGDVVLLACSGGPDSMCLADILVKYRKKVDFKIVLVHVHHNVRKESDEEFEFVSKYAKENDLIFESMKINKYENKNFESEARDKRYAFFRKIQEKYNAKYLFTAHHGDDLMETILMRIVRGSSLKGYAGFSKVTDLAEYKILRPLINVTKKDIIEYNKENNLKYYNDYTNELDVHTRNRYRKYILPRLKDEDANVNLKFSKFSNLLMQYNSFVDDVALKIMKHIYKDSVLDIDEYKKQDDLIKTVIINKILAEVYKDEIMYLASKHVDNIKKLIESNSSNLTLNLPKGYVALKSYNNFYITLKKQIDDYKYTFDKKITLPNGHSIEMIKESDNNSNFICKLSSKEIKLPLIVRNKKDGDIIYVMNMKGHKKVKDIFIDSKISLADRKKWPIVTDSENNILWIPGIKKSKYNKQKEEKYDIILKYY